MSNEKHYILWLDLIRVTSILLVILIHAASPVYNNWELPFGDWLTGVLYNTVARVSVPLMFMVSGYLLLSRQEEMRPFFLRRFRKVLIPFAAWSVIYLLWNNHGYPEYTFINAAKAIALTVITKPASYHLWFINVLALIYLFVPAMRVFVRAADTTHIRYIAWMWILLGPVLNYVEQEYLAFKTIIDLGFFTEYIGYFYLGYVLGNLTVSPRRAWLAGGVYLAVGAYTVWAAQHWSLAKGQYVDFYHNYLRLTIALMSIAAFILLKYWGERWQQHISPLGARALRHLASVSFGMYLSHVLTLTMLNWGTFGFRLTTFSAPVAWMIPALALVVALISYLITLLLRRIPILREIVPA